MKQIILTKQKLSIIGMCSNKFAVMFIFIKTYVFLLKIEVVKTNKFAVMFFFFKTCVFLLKIEVVYCLSNYFTIK